MRNVDVLFLKFSGHNVAIESLFLKIGIMEGLIVKDRNL